MHQLAALVKDRLILTLLFVTGLLFVGSIWFIQSMTKTTPSSQTSTTEASTSNKLQIDEQDHVKGTHNAAVTLVEYFDFECSACGVYHGVMQELEKGYGDRVTFVYRHFPLTGHPNAMNAALAAEAAAKQGQWQAMYDLLFDKQAEWGGKTASNRSIFEGYAKELGLDVEQFRIDAVAKEVRERVERDLQSGKKLGVNSTPSFFINGERINNPSTTAAFRALLDTALQEASAAANAR